MNPTAWALAGGTQAGAQGTSFSQGLGDGLLWGGVGAAVVGVGAVVGSAILLNGQPSQEDIITADYLTENERISQERAHAAGRAAKTSSDAAEVEAELQRMLYDPERQVAFFPALALACAGGGCQALAAGTVAFLEGAAFVGSAAAAAYAIRTASDALPDLWYAEGLDPTSPAKDVLPGSLRPVFPGEHLDKSLNQIKEALKTARGPAKKALQKAKKLLEQSDRLKSNTRGGNQGRGK